MGWSTDEGGGFTPTAAQRVPFGNAGATGLIDSADFLWNDTDKVLTLGRGGTARLTATIGGGGAATIAGSDDQQVMLTAKATGKLVLGTNNTARATILFTGEMGLGAEPAAGDHLYVLGANNARSVLDSTAGDPYFKLKTGGTERGGMGCNAGLGAFVYAQTHDLYFDTNTAGKDIIVRPAVVERLRVTATGDVVIGNGNTGQTTIATNATAGFLRLPGCAGAPTGAAVNGSMVVDTTNSKLYVRIAGAWVVMN